MPQQTKDERNQVGLQLVPVSSSYFAPKNTIYLNKDKMLWWADLEDTSQVVKIMKGETQKVGGTEETPSVPQTSPNPNKTK
jgi:hypothetical protein